MHGSEAFLCLFIYFNQYLLSDYQGASTESGTTRNKNMKASCLFQSVSSIREVTRPHGPVISEQRRLHQEQRGRSAMSVAAQSEDEGCVKGDWRQRALEG